MECLSSPIRISTISSLLEQNATENRLAQLPSRLAIHIVHFLFKVHNLQDEALFIFEKTSQIFHGYSEVLNIDPLISPGSAYASG